VWSEKDRGRERENGARGGECAYVHVCMRARAFMYVRVCTLCVMCVSTKRKRQESRRALYKRSRFTRTFHSKTRHTRTGHTCAFVQAQTCIESACKQVATDVAARGLDIKGFTHTTCVVEVCPDIHTHTHTHTHTQTDTHTYRHTDTTRREKEREKETETEK